MFSLTQIAVCAAASGILSVVALTLAPPADGPWLRRALPLAIVVALANLVWRAAANTSVLNDDPMPFVSPNDVLAPVFTYVCLGLYGGVSDAARQIGWPRSRLILTVVSLIANVVTI